MVEIKNKSEGDEDLYLEFPSKIDRTYIPAKNRYNNMIYRRCGVSGLMLPAITLGLWQNFDDSVPYSKSRELLLKAFDMGITYFDLANNYGNPPGSAEKTLGRLLVEDLKPYRNQLIVSTKAGYDMWPGPYGDKSSKKYLIASLDQSLKRLGLDYVDIFYSHRYDPHTPLEETMGALDQIVKSGKALYVGISSYGITETVCAAEILKGLGTPCIVHQPSYSLFNRKIESGLLPKLKHLGMGCVTFTALEQGLLTDKYVKGLVDENIIPSGSRMDNPESLLRKDIVTPDLKYNLKNLKLIAEERGQTLSQMAIAWTIRNPEVASTIIGVRTLFQLEENLGALKNINFSKEELEKIDLYAKDMEITLWPLNC